MLEKVLDQVRARGPIAVGDVEGRVRNPGTWWNWDDAKLALEILFDQGVVSVTRRQSDFARLYDLIERIVPAEVLAAPPIPEHEARRQLLMLAARSLGVATLTDLCDYYRLNATDAQADRRRAGRRRLAGRPSRSTAGTSRRSSTPRPRRRAASPAAPCSPRSTRWSGSASARSACSTSTTGSRSTRRSRSGSTATTCSRSCSTASSSGGSTSRPTAAAGVLRAQATWVEDDLDNPRRSSSESPSSSPPSSARWPAGSVSSNGVVAAARGNLAKDLLGAPNVMPIVESDA